MDRISVSLRVTGERLDPEYVSRFTGLSPTSSFRVGDQVSRHGEASKLTRKHGFWGYSLKAVDGSQLCETIRWILKRTPANLGDLVKDQDGFVDLFVGLFGVRDQSTCELDVDVMRELASRNWPIIFDMYTE